ncbi:MAG: hypothetical protein ACOYIG_05840 [Acetivibrionales bacterium]|jgi:hypothetical protein
MSISIQPFMFYLTTAGEYKLLSKPRACWFIRRLKDANRDDYMLVKIAPPLIGQPFGLGEADVHELLLSTRHRGYSLYPVTEWPTYVYVARVVDQSVFEAESFTREQVQLIAWGMIFDDLQEATNRAVQLEPDLI